MSDEKKTKPTLEVPELEELFARLHPDNKSLDQSLRYLYFGMLVGTCFRLRDENERLHVMVADLTGRKE